MISQSPTDMQPVFDTIAARRAEALQRQFSANAFTFDGELIHLVAIANVDRGRSRRHPPLMSAAARPRQRGGRAMLDVPYVA